MASSTNLREFILIVQEQQLGVPCHASVTDTPTPQVDYAPQTATALVVATGNAVPAPTTLNAIFVRIDGGNAFTMRVRPVAEDIMSGGGYAYIGQTVAGRMALTGTLQTKLYANQAKFLLDWACTPKSSTSVPWPNIDPSSGRGGTATGDLCSCTIYHAIRRSDGTYRTRMYGGVKVMGGTLSASADTQVVTLNLTLQGARPAKDLYYATDLNTATTQGAHPVSWANDPAMDAYTVVNDPMKIPDPNFYPTDVFLFTHSRGKLILNPNTESPAVAYRTQFSSISLNFGNKCDARSFENRYVTKIQFLGRQATLTAKILYKPAASVGMGSAEDRDYLETLQGHDMQFGFDNGSVTSNQIKTINFNFQSGNVIRDLMEDTPVDRIYEQTVEVQNIYDYPGGTPTDFTFTATPV